MAGARRSYGTHYDRTTETVPGASQCGRRFGLISGLISLPAGEGSEAQNMHLRTLAKGREGFRLARYC